MSVGSGIKWEGRTAAAVDYYFSIVSPWAYIGHDAFHDMAKRHDVEVNYKPMALLEVFDATGTLRLPNRHQTRKDYRMLELQRWRENAVSTSTCSPTTGRFRSSPPTA